MPPAFKSSEKSADHKNSLIFNVLLQASLDFNDMYLYKYVIENLVSEVGPRTITHIMLKGNQTHIELLKKFYDRRPMTQIQRQEICKSVIENAVLSKNVSNTVLAYNIFDAKNILSGYQISDIITKLFDTPYVGMVDMLRTLAHILRDKLLMGQIDPEWKSLWSRCFMMSLGIYDIELAKFCSNIVGYYQHVMKIITERIYEFVDSSSLVYDIEGNTELLTEVIRHVIRHGDFTEDQISYYQRIIYSAESHEESCLWRNTIISTYDEYAKTLPIHLLPSDILNSHILPELNYWDLANLTLVCKGLKSHIDCPTSLHVQQRRLYFHKAVFREVDLSKNHYERIKYLFETDYFVTKEEVFMYLTRCCLDRPFSPYSIRIPAIIYCVLSENIEMLEFMIKDFSDYYRNQKYHLKWKRDFIDGDYEKPAFSSAFTNKLMKKVFSVGNLQIFDIIRNAIDSKLIILEDEWHPFSSYKNISDYVTRAVKKGKVEIIKKMLSIEQTKWKKDGYMKSAFTHACKYRKFNCLKPFSGFLEELDTQKNDSFITDIRVCICHILETPEFNEFFMDEFLDATPRNTHSVILKILQQEVISYSALYEITTEVALQHLVWISKKGYLDANTGLHDVASSREVSFSLVKYFVGEGAFPETRNNAYYKIASKSGIGADLSFWYLHKIIFGEQKFDDALTLSLGKYDRMAHFIGLGVSDSNYQNAFEYTKANGSIDQIRIIEEARDRYLNKGRPEKRQKIN
jgi:hypothetical protein